MPIVEKEKTQLEVDQIALFNKFKMLMELSSNESETFRLLTTGIYNGNLNVRNKNGMYIINMEKGKSKYKLKGQNGSIKAILLTKIKKQNLDPIGFGLRYMSRDSENRKMHLWD